MNKHLSWMVSPFFWLACGAPSAPTAEPPSRTDGGEHVLLADARIEPPDADVAWSDASTSGSDAAATPSSDASIGGTADDASNPDAPDASSPMDPPDAGPGPSPGCVGAGCECIRASEMWTEDFERGDYARWTGGGYGDPWGDGCQGNALSFQHPHGGAVSQRSEIVCASSSPDGVHRGYGGLQWSGDTRLPDYTNRGVGMDAPHGIVTTFWTWLESGYAFGDGRWVSLFTINPTCDYTQRVVTVGLDRSDWVVRAAHYWPEGALTLAPDAPAFPRGQWVRMTVYVNLNDGAMHVWQDGRSVEHVSGIVRESHALCQWHWGLYASGDNTDVVLYEDDKSVWKLEEAWTDFSREPWLGATQAVCGAGG